MQTEATLHSVSSSLRDLLPYKDPPFTSAVDPQQVTTAYGRRAVNKYSALLEVEGLSDEDRVIALDELHDMLSNQEVKVRAVEQGVVDQCTRLLASEADRVAGRAANVLECLAVVVQGRQEMSRCGSFAVLCRLLAHRSLAVRSAAAAALFRVSSMRDGVQLLNGEDGRVGDLVGAIALENPAQPPEAPLVLLHCVSTIARCTSLLSGVEKALAAGAVSRLVLLTTAAWASPRVTVQVLACVWNLCNHLDGKVQAIEQGAVPQIAALLRGEAAEGDSEEAVAIRRCGSGALMAMSIDEAGKPAILEYAVSELAALLTDANESTRHNARLTFNHVAESVDGPLLCTRAIAHDAELLAWVFGHRAALPLNELLLDESTEVRVNAARCLAGLSATPEGREAVLGCLHIVERLFQLLTVPATKDGAADTLLNCVENPVLRAQAARLAEHTDRFRQAAAEVPELAMVLSS